MGRFCHGHIFLASSCLVVAIKVAHVHLVGINSLVISAVFRGVLLPPEPNLEDQGRVLDYFTLGMWAPLGFVPRLTPVPLGPFPLAFSSSTLNSILIAIPTQ